MDIITQNSNTTVVEPIVSVFVGYEIFFSSPRTSDKNSVMEDQAFLNMLYLMLCDSLNVSSISPQTVPPENTLAGAPGFEPGLSVLETDVLTIDTMPLQ